MMMAPKMLVQSRAAGDSVILDALGGFMAHSYTNLVFHIIFGIKERRPLIDVDFQLRLYEYIGGTIRGLKATSLAIGRVEDKSN